MKFKKLVCWLLCIMFVMTAVLFSACQPDPIEVIDDLKFDEYGDPIFIDDNGQGITLNVWSVIGSPDNTYLSLVNSMFNDYYRVNGLAANLTSVEQGSFYNQIANTITTDPRNAPDVVIIHSERLTYFVGENILVSMDQAYEKLGVNNTFSASNYLDNVISECYVDNTLYGVPLDVHSGVWYLREDIIERNGLRVPTNKTEFEAVCQSLMQKKADGTLWVRSLDDVKRQIDALSNSTDYDAIARIRNNAWRQVGASTDFYPVEMSGADNIESGWIPQTAVIQNGGKLSNPDGTPAWNTSTGLKNTLEMIDGWQDTYIGPNRDANTLWANVGNGNAVFGCEGPWWMESRLNEYDRYLGVGSLGILSLSNLYADDNSSDTASKIYGVGHAFGITNTQANASITRRVAAALYAQYMTENAIQYTQGGHLPACKAILENPEYLNSQAYNRYLKYMGSPEDYVMLGNTPYFSPVYEQMKFAYIWTLSKNRSGTVEEHIDGCYKNAIDDINALKGL